MAKRRAAVFLSAFALGALAIGAERRVRASDHVDGVKTAIDNAADITDVFTFTSPKDPSKVVVVMNVHGLATSVTRFSNAVDYQLRIRPIEDTVNLAPSRDAAKERRVVCSFAGGLPLVEPNQKATCRLDLEDGTETVRFETRGDGYVAGGEGTGRGVRVFAGVRSDPWFLDLAKTLKYNGAIPIAPGPGINGLWGQNVLSIVVEIDKSRLPGPMLAVNAQTVRK